MRGVLAAMSACLLLAASPAGAQASPPVTPDGDPSGGAPLATPTPRPQPAPPPPKPEAPTPVDALIVVAPGPAPEVDAVKAFVGEISAGTVNGRLARWDRKICVGVINLKPEYAQRLADRVSAVAQSVDLQTGDPGCKPNIFILGTADSQTLARDLVKENPEGFGKWGQGVTRGRKALKSFVEDLRPVRWWHVSRTANAEGELYYQGENVRVRQVGRVKATTRDQFASVVIILDVTQIGQIRFEALSDYVAMVALADIAPDADSSDVPTILNLFADRATGRTPPAGLTAWDLAYLQGLYSTQREVRSGERQQDEIAGKMQDRLGAEDKRGAGEEDQE